jgi:hypothetical protein
VAPNAALQRTRVRPAGGRSPLSLKTLGTVGLVVSRLGLLLIAVFLLGSRRPAHKCGGHLVVELSRKGPFTTSFPLLSPGAPPLILGVAENQRGGWLLSVYRDSDGVPSPNLIGEGFGLKVDGKVDIDAMNVPYFQNYPDPLIFPIRSTNLSLCVGFNRAKARGSGAAASFTRDSVIEVRLMPNRGAHGA